MDERKGCWEFRGGCSLMGGGGDLREERGKEAALMREDLRRQNPFWIGGVEYYL